jgi:hypothetical protein
VADFTRLGGDEVASAFWHGWWMLSVMAKSATCRCLTVIEHGWCPCNCSVAAVAGIGGCHMRGALACIRQACWRVAGNASACDLAVVNWSCSRRPLVGVVARIAGVGCCKVGVALARNLGVVVAGEAGACHLRVVNRSRGWCELNCCMAGFAQVGRRHMCAALAESGQFCRRMA